MFLSCSDSEGLLGFCLFLFFLANNFGILASWLCFLFDIFLFSTLSIQFKYYDIRDTTILEFRSEACFPNSYSNSNSQLNFQIFIRIMIRGMISKFLFEIEFETLFINSYCLCNLLGSGDIKISSISRDLVFGWDR